MRMYLRLLLVVLCSFFRRKNLSISSESILRLTCMPWDCVLRYMGNDRFFAFMDLGRVDLLCRLGWLKVVLRQKWHPFVVTSFIQYRYPVRIFQTVTVHTRIVFWDSRFFWMEHELRQGGKVHASAISKNVAITSKGVVSTSLIFFMLKEKTGPLDLPEKVRIVNDLDAACRQGNKTAS